MPMSAEDKVDLVAKLTASRKKALNFGVCIASKPDECALVIHRVTTPEILKKKAKKLGGSAKTACGTIKSKGKLVMLTCFDGPPPGSTKKLKKFLKVATGEMMKVQFLDTNGGVLESDDDDEQAEQNPGNNGPSEGDSSASTELAGKFEATPDAAPGTAQLSPDKLSAPKPETRENAADEFSSSDTWGKMRAVLAPRIEATLKANHPDADRIRAVWGFALEKAECGDNSTAIKTGKRLISMLTSSGFENAQSDVPEDVVAFQKSRITWIAAKRDMQKGLASFRLAVAKQADDDHDKAEIVAAADSLVAEFTAFDERLEDCLDQITRTVEGSERTQLKKTAHAVIQDYIKVLEGPFFSIVDDNPFVSVNVAARGGQSLSAIRATLT